jgi:hypothetical protein
MFILTLLAQLAQLSRGKRRYLGELCLSPNTATATHHWTFVLAQYSQLQNRFPLFSVHTQFKAAQAL